MGQYTSYWLYQKYEQRGSQEPIPVYPNAYSINGDGTMTPVVRNDDDPQCGYVPPVEPTYRWTNIPITQDYICDGCNIAQYRWVNLDPIVDYYCEGTTKYYKQKRQVSYDEGITWQDVIPYEYQKGGVAESQSTDCGYVPPTPTTKKLVATYIGGTIRDVECNGNGTLTSGETKPSGYEYTGLTDAVIGECVTVIGESAFRSGTANPPSLTAVTIPNTVTSIGDYAFFSNFDTIKRINSNVDGECNIPSGVTSIGSGTFGYCRSLTSVTIPNSVTSIGDNAFNGCSGLTSVIIPDSVTTFGNGVFDACSGLTSATIGSGVTSIGAWTFGSCTSLRSVNIPSGVTSIGYDAFNGCSSLTSVTIPNSVTSIGEEAFWKCSSLTSATIGSGVTSIGVWAFNSCSGLTSVTCLATTPPALGLGVFDDTNNCPILVPSQSVSAYKTATNWRAYASRIQSLS